MIEEEKTSNNREINNNLTISPARFWVIGYNTTESFPINRKLNFDV